jgi:hypothetical protein
MTNLWLDEEEARRRVDETLDLFSPEHEVIEEIVREDARPSLRRRLARALTGVGRNAADVLDASEQVIVEPGDLMGTRYVVWRPERFDY